MNRTAKFEEAVEAWGKSVEQGLSRWIQRDRSLNFLRTTRARVVLWAFTYTWMFSGFVVVVMRRPQWSGYWFAGLLVFYIIHRISIRDLFQMPEPLLDELQIKRRNKSYRRAYRNFGGWVILLIAGYAYASTYDSVHTSRMVSAWILIPALWVLAPYLAAGFKGERED